ncbi:MAG TPA: hypothetical protein DEE98_01670 [Elusimicrobia bacterium]|nr:MAG: hypothetical protein A2278_06045 [Elusimicrobia bacterium RIFOXYA12_FULL_49_49]OGS08386.1 MAG: hypothetical protein A2204_08255 [Elusimicrobia bacterium RIFOXYA1_FULL_47_7]OGS10869.1 MAG: hypothetical protein A2386_06095 [Elusimicrobia bacterium RIFOXYB1_FULL_48_9]OGS16647.1 MAG: hypothetical protein A2251_04690 [Elusimicrobia bacterium RIFOXYA2_FULL_47_53]OGS25496.1 MAG: hypothetical protein A2339_00265 [Elusimicrobia bacterium RIFOXYB12_FULL_50_12]OGS31625.1 MAG: hypothetical protein
MDTISNQINKLFSAELQFRLASAVRLAVTEEEQPLDLPKQWTYGRHTVKYNEVAIRKDQAGFAALCLQRSATYLMAVAIKDAIKAIITDPKNHKDLNIRNSYQIARLIRNAFAHSPFHPIWSIDEDCRDKIFEVKDIIILNTKGLDRTSFDWRHYGGPLAILKLCQFVRFKILEDKNRRPEERAMPEPKNNYIQFGDLILKKIDTIPKGAKRIKVKKSSDGSIDLGRGYFIR